MKPTGTDGFRRVLDRQGHEFRNGKINYIIHKAMARIARRIRLVPATGEAGVITRVTARLISAGRRPQGAQ